MRQRIRRIEKALADAGFDAQDAKNERDKIAFERAIQEFFEVFGVMNVDEFAGMLNRDGVNMEDVSKGELAEYFRAKVRAKTEDLKNEPQK